MHSQMKGRIVCDSFLNCIGCCLDARTLLPTTCTPCGCTPPRQPEFRNRDDEKQYSDHGLFKVCASLRPRIPMYSNGCPWAGLWPECMPTRVRRSRTTVPSNAARGAVSVLDRWGVRCTAGGMCVTEMTNSMPLHGVVNVTCLEST